MGGVFQGSESACGLLHGYRAARVLQAGGRGHRLHAAGRLEGLLALAVRPRPSTGASREIRGGELQFLQSHADWNGGDAPALAAMCPRHGRAPWRGARPILCEAEVSPGSKTEGARDGEEYYRRAARRSCNARLDEF